MKILETEDKETITTYFMKFYVEDSKHHQRYLLSCSFKSDEGINDIEFLTRNERGKEITTELVFSEEELNELRCYAFVQFKQNPY